VLWVLRLIFPIPGNGLSKLGEFAIKENKMQHSHSIDGLHELDHLKNELEEELKKKFDEE
jgi:hypothetical protein